MPDKARISKVIDELQIDAIDEHQRYRAALLVCSEMERMGGTRDEVRDVLGALDLIGAARARRRPQ